MRKFVLIFSALVLCAQLAIAQNVRISGRVTNTDGEPIIGATVIQKGTNNGVGTNVSGEYTITAPADATLEFAFLGMQTQDIQIGSRTRIDVVLNSDAKSIDEVVVVAYGTAKKSSFTGSVETVKAGDISKRNTSSVTKAIEGTVAGVQTTAGGGQPGTDAAIRIRGFGSMSASNTPLYVVDGVPYDGYISAINPSDIESMSILKDASASALYGARGANGVVIITTKRGKEGKMIVNFKADFGVSKRSLGRYETVGIPEYMEMSRELYGPGFISKLGGEYYNPYSVPTTELFDSNGKVKADTPLRWNEDWYKEGERKGALRQDYLVSISGGTEKAQYLMSVGYLNEQGLLKSTDFNRISATANVDTKPAEWIKAGVSLLTSSTKQNATVDDGSSYTNFWYSSTSIAPIYPVYAKDANGNDTYDINGKKIYDYGSTRPIAANSNALGDLAYNQRTNKNDNLSGRAYVNFDTDKDIAFIKDLSLAVNIGADYYARNLHRYYNSQYGQFVTAGGIAYKENMRNLSYTFNQLLTYKKQLGDHNIDLLVGHEYYDMEFNTTYAEKKGFAFPGLTELDAAATITDAGSYIDKYRVESYLSRLNYDFANKYYFSASFRTDGSSRFHKDSRWGNFWSVGASWRMSEEGFLKDVSWLNNLTLKASYGVQGNDNLSGLVNGLTDNRYYAWQGLYSLSYPNASNGGVFPTSISNPNLKWEKNKNLNVGVEASMFNNRLRVSAEYFIKNTDDLLMQRPLANSTGFSYYLDNVGSMQNKGVDFTISGTPIAKGDFRWDMTLLGSHVKNKVTRLNDNLENLTPSNVFITKVGYPINSFYTAFSAGVDPQTGAQLYMYYDKDGNEQITKDYNTANANRTDANITGSRVPDLYGSFTNTFTYKGFDLSVMLTYSIGGKIYDSSYFSLMETRGAGSNMHKDLYDNRWQKPGDITDVPKLSSAAKYQTDFYLVNASYLSLKNITFGYTFAQSWMKKAGIESLRFSVIANNLCVWSHRKGMDPQYDFNGQVDYSYVPIRNISFGVDLKF